MSPSREDDDATIGPERKPAPAADQTLALPDASQAGSASDATFQLTGAPAGFSYVSNGAGGVFHSCT